MSFRITRRDLAIAITALALGAGAATHLSAAQETELKSTAFDWNAFPPSPTDVGSVRQFVTAKTTTLEQLEMHVTTLNPGKTSHAPHKHPNEELVIIREGTVEVLVRGEWKRLGPGSVVFNASNELHGLRNVGNTPATYHVINWTTPATHKAQQ